MTELTDNGWYRIQLHMSRLELWPQTRPHSRSVNVKTTLGFRCRMDETYALVVWIVPTRVPVWDAAVSPGQLGVGCATLKERSGQSTKALQANRSPDNNILLRMHELNWNGHIWMLGFEHIFFPCLSIFSSQAKCFQCTSKNIPVVVTAMVKLDILFIYINMEKLWQF